MYDLEGSNDVDPLETPYTGSTLDLIHGQVHPFHGIEQGSLLLEINLTSIYPTCAQGPRDPPVLVHCAHAHANPGGFHHKLHYKSPGNILPDWSRLRNDMSLRGKTFMTL